MRRIIVLTPANLAAFSPNPKSFPDIWKIKWFFVEFRKVMNLYTWDYKILLFLVKYVVLFYLQNSYISSICSDVAGKKLVNTVWILKPLLSRAWISVSI